MTAPIAATPMAQEKNKAAIPPKIMKNIYKNNSDSKRIFNKLNNKGGILLTEAFHKNNTLLSLDFSINKLGPREGKALAKAPHNNTTLTSLNLFNNNLGHEGIFND
ncbi:hypothetical protein C2G38_2202881 [Gigaspora rosea]|uniref:Uncharacterized protein n=1 Tax=Gigaspora rosea TaxID=44941 RepID=A0A397UN34_9GLOM|nr:hypothetical protein C2G38_2202881 [Gigaspora rosea]